MTVTMPSETPENRLQLTTEEEVSPADSAFELSPDNRVLEDESLLAEEVVTLFETSPKSPLLVSEINDEFGGTAEDGKTPDSPYQADINSAFPTNVPASATFIRQPRKEVMVKKPILLTRNRALGRLQDGAKGSMTTPLRSSKASNKPQNFGKKTPVVDKTIRLKEDSTEASADQHDSASKSTPENRRWSTGKLLSSSVISRTFSISDGNSPSVMVRSPPTISSVRNNRVFELRFLEIEQQRALRTARKASYRMYIQTAYLFNRVPKLELAAGFP